MKIQASIEFLLILSAISILALATITIYTSRISVEHSALASSINSLNTLPQSFNIADTANVEVALYMPINSVVGSGNAAVLAFYGCSNGTANVYTYSEGLVFAENSINNLSISNIGIANIHFVPINPGINNATLKYNGICEGNSFNGILSTLTYSTEPEQNIYLSNYSSQMQAYAYIANRNEEIIYNQTSPMQINNINVWSHCNYDSFFTSNPSPYLACGTDNGWVYESFNGYCYSMNYGPSNPTCIIPSSTSYEIREVGVNYSESYSFYLLISYEGMLFNASITGPEAKVYLGNTVVGSASVIGVNGAGPLTSAYTIYNSSKSGFANTAAYQTYIQAKNNMYNILSYYNMTGVSGAIISNINEAITAYQKAAAQLEESQYENITGCAISNSIVECRPLYPFSYTINVTLDKDSGLRLNATLYYQGSIINIKTVSV
jgi:hypothetical protein